MAKLVLSLGSISAMLALILGAFGAHGLKARLAADMLAVYQTGVQYHFYHSLGLLIIGVLALHVTGSAWLKWSAWAMLGGIVLFSGSLYLLALTGLRWLGMIAPLGGTAFIAAWLLLLIAILNFK